MTELAMLLIELLLIGFWLLVAYCFYKFFATTNYREFFSKEAKPLSAESPIARMIVYTTLAGCVVLVLSII